MEQTTNKLETWLRCHHALGTDLRSLPDLLNRFGDAAGILTASRSDLTSCGLRTAAVERFRNLQDISIDRDLDWLSSSPEHHIIPIDDPRYPDRLRRIEDAPVLLYVRGDPDYLNQPQLAMVGSRSPTAVGSRTAEDFAEHLSNAGITITSGLATGIDGASHTGALRGIAGTIAVVAHGLDIVYPSRHRGLAEEICRNGALISDCPVGTEPKPFQFPRRNRLIAGLSLGTLVVEAALKSGSLITARLASEAGREVFAIPGSIHNPLARGCHRLIRQGAKLVETADDILEELFPHLKSDSKTAAPPSPTTDSEASSTGALDPDHQKLLKCLANGAMSVDLLVLESGFSAAEIASMLLILELEGHVVGQNGLYSRIGLEDGVAP